MNRQILTIGLGVVAIAIAAWVLLRPEPLDLPLPSGADAPPNVPQTTPEERAEDARGVIASLQEGGNVNYDEAFSRAQAFQEEGRLADAQLLYFFGARAGHADSAYALATMYDPNHHDPGTSLFEEPDAFQAYRWYSAAREQGLEAANQRLDALRDWAETAAADGDAEAERLLLQWD